MTTFANLIADVKRDLNATKGHRYSDDDIRSAINDAIDEYESYRFTFNEGTTSITTIPGQESYPVPSNLLEIDEILHEPSTRRHALRRVSFREHAADSFYLNVEGSWSTEYAIHGERIYLYPLPNTIQPLTIFGLLKLTPTPLSDPRSTNGWTTNGKRVIRARAAWDLSLHRGHNPDLAAMFASAEDRHLKKLKRETRKLLATGQSYAPAGVIC